MQDKLHAGQYIRAPLRTELELSHLEELLDRVLSFDFFIFFLVEEADFSLVALESVVIVEVSASTPKPSCLTCPESRELRLEADGGETTKV
jgi:hypothetical protein